MKLTGFGDYDWEADGYYAGLPVGYQNFVGVNPQVITRVGTTATFGPGTVSERTIPVEFGYNGALTHEVAWSTLMNRLRPTDTVPRQLRAEMNDGTQVTIPAVMSVASSGNGEINTLTVTFTAVDAVWTAQTASSATKTFGGTLANIDEVLTVNLTGYHATPLTFSIEPTVARSSSTSTVGWTYRRIYRVTNNTGETLVDYPYAIDLGTTTSLVSGGKALSTGNDVRVVSDGTEYARTLVNWNSASYSTLVWIVIPLLPDGESNDYEVWYGNSAAGSPTTLTGNSAPAIDITTAGASRSTNASWRYRVDATSTPGDAGYGGWYISSGTSQPGIRSFSVPAAWRPVRTLPNTDTAAQPTYSEFSTGYYIGRFDAQRARAGVSLDVVDGTSYDGVALTNPAGISSVQYDLTVTNDETSAADTSAIGRVVLLSRQATGDDWSRTDIHTAVASTATTVATATTSYSPKVKSVAFAVWPSNRRAIDDAAGAARSVTAKWRSTLVVAVDSSVITQTQTQAEESIYEIATEIRHGGDTSLTAPYSAVRLGQRASASSRLAVRLGTEKVVVDMATRTAKVYAGSTFVSDVPYVAIAAYDGVQVGTSVVERTSQTWVALAPYTNPLTNPTFASATTGWSYGTTASGCTMAALARDTSTYKTSPASLVAGITANTAAAGTMTTIDASQVLPVNGRACVIVTAELRTTVTTLRPRLQIRWYSDTSGTTLLSTSTAANYTPAATTWYRRSLASRVPAGALSYRIGVALVTTSSGVTGSAHIDEVTVNGNEVVVTETSAGTYTVSASWVATYP